MGWLGRSLGDFGSQIGQGYDIAKNWRQRDQDIKIAVARQKLAELIGPLQVQQLQEELNRSRQPEARGFVSTPGGGTSGVTFQGGKYATQPLVPGMDKGLAKQKIMSMIYASPKGYQGTLQAYADSIDAGEDPLFALEKAEAVLGQAAGKVAIAEGKTSFKFEPEKGIITDKKGKEWSIYDPQLPPELKTLVNAEQKRKDQEAEKKATIEAQKTADALDRALKIGDMREAQKQYDEVFKTAKRGIAGHSFLKTVETQVEAAKQGGGAGTTSGDMALVEGYMQLMFGIDPKALRGSPKMMEVMLKQGGVDDRTVAWFNTLISGGKLSQDVREEILANAKRQVQSWDSAVSMTGDLVDNQKVKDLVGRYEKTIGAGQTIPPPPPGYVIQPQPGAPK